MLNSRPLISIIIPVYNAGSYIQHCLESIIKQTYDNIEIICINDGSNDQSLQVINSIASDDKRFHVIDIPNQGVSNARNFGLSIASGRYVMFVDADDWINADCLELLLGYTQMGCDIIMFPYISEYSEKSFKHLLFNNDIIFEGEDLKKLARRIIGPLGEEIKDPTSLDRYGSVWGKIYLKTIACSSAFVDLSVIGTAEDSLYNMELFKSAKKVAYTNKTFYHYRKENANSITSTHRPNLVEKWKNQYNLIRQLCNTEEDFQALRNRVGLNVLGATLNGFNSYNKYNALNSILNDNIYHNALKQLPLKHFEPHWKLFYYCARNRMTSFLYCLLWIIKKLR